MAVWNSTTSCPSFEPDVVSRGSRLGCQEGREYHCLLDQDGVPGEICEPKTLIEAVHCPEYNTDIRNLEVYTCNQSHGVCPTTVYWSNTSFRYSGCMYVATTQNTTTERSTISIHHSNLSSSNMIPIVAVIAGVGTVIVLITFIAIWMCRRVKSNQNDKEYRSGDDHDLTSDEKASLLELDEHMLQKGKISLEEHYHDTTYIPTQGFIWTTEVMLTHNVAVISGIVGSGKTKTALHTASTWKEEDEHRRLLLIESIHEIPDVLTRNLDNVFIIMDDCFTRWTLECTEGSLYSTCVELYHRVCHSNNVKLIITIDHNIYQRHKLLLSHMDLFKEHLIVTLPIEMASQTDFIRNRPNMKELLQEERKQILRSYIEHHNEQHYRHMTYATSQVNIPLEDTHKIISRQYVDIGFPSICVMFVRLYKTAELKSDFFQFCDTRILQLLRKLKKTEGKKGKQKKCILSYAMLRDNSIDLDELDLVLLNKLGERYKSEFYDLQAVISIVKDMSKTFLIQSKNKMFKIAYTVMYNKHINEWIYKRPHDFLELCSTTLIKETIRPEGYQPKCGEPIFVVKEAAHITHLAQRFKELLPIHLELKYHPVMSNKDFQIEMEKHGQKCEFADPLYDYYDNTYDEIEDFLVDPEKGGRNLGRYPHTPKKDTVVV